MEKCIICQEDTDQCCSLCRKAFYCSQDHQETDWHMKHKHICEGRKSMQMVDNSREEFRIYPHSVSKSSAQTIKNETQAKHFFGLYSLRQANRKKLIDKYQNSEAEECRKMVHELLQLQQLSANVTENYHPSINNIVSETYGIETNDFFIKIDQLLDKVLLARVYLKAGMYNPLKELMIRLMEQTEPFPKHLADCQTSIYINYLRSVIDVSEMSNLDTVSEKMYAHYIRVVERLDGTWQQIYAYYSMGVWYAKKTYYNKAIRCFSYAMDLILAHKNKETVDNAAELRGDILFNKAQCQWVSLEPEKAINDMKEAYRLKVQSVGRSNVQTSACLYKIAEWCLQQRLYNQSVQSVQQCLRIRKINMAGHEKQYEDAKQLVKKIYETIKRDKQSDRESLHPRGHYYDKLLNNMPSFDDSENKESFTERILQVEREEVLFRLNPSQDFGDTLSSEQWMHLTKLVELIDTKMEKQEAIRKCLQSQFYLSLTQEQKDTFRRENTIL